MKVKNIIRLIEVNIRQFIWAINKSVEPTGQDRVDYDGYVCYLVNSGSGDNIWDIFTIGTNVRLASNVKGGDIKITHSWKRSVRLVKHSMFFQFSAWEKIDMMNPIGTRLSYLSSNDIKFYNKHD